MSSYPYFQLIDRRALVRHDDDRGYGIRVTGRDDRSPIHLTYPTGYAAECGYCWLGGNHSENYHNAQLEAAAEEARVFPAIGVR
jgi:hypothetical protein